MMMRLPVAADVSEARGPDRRGRLQPTDGPGSQMRLRGTAADRGALSDSRPFIIRGMLVLGIAFGGFGTWSVAAPLDSGVIAPGTVIVDGRRKKVQHQQGGVVDALLVREGDRVTEGQVLLRLDPTRARVSENIQQGAYDASRAEEARLNAELNSAATLEFPPDLMAKASDPRIAKLLDGQRRLFIARRTALFGQTEILKNQIEQSRKEIAGLEAESRANVELIGLLREETGRLQQLLTKGLTERSRVFALERELRRLSGQQGAKLAAIARIEKAISKIELEIIQTHNTNRERIVGELRELHTRLHDSKERLADAEYVADKTAVRAPVDGTVVNLQVHTRGGVVGPGDLIMELVPADEQLIVDARIAPSDIDLVTNGRAANILFPVFSQSAPTLKGIVTHISADRLTDANTGEPYYEAHINIPDAEIGRLNDNEKLVAGMPAEVIVVTGERTVLDYLLQPLAQSFRRAWQE